MSYEKHTWVNNEAITASKLNNIERGVESVNSEYTPTTWVEGDTVTAAKLNKIEQGIANASGGGSSDYSTCTLTIVNEGASYFTLNSAFKYENGELDDITLTPDTPATMFPQLWGGPNETVEGTVVLYKGEAYAIFTGGTPTYTLSGDITMFDPEWPDGLHITGDGTITITDSQ